MVKIEEKTCIEVGQFLNLGEPPQAPGTKEHIGRAEKNFLNVVISYHLSFNNNIKDWRTDLRVYVKSLPYKCRGFAGCHNFCQGFAKIQGKVKPPS